jgi:uncharacterized protein YlzI (FlbEa/FlbD family)
VGVGVGVGVMVVVGAMVVVGVGVVVEVGVGKGNKFMIKFTTIENRTIYVNPSLIASIEIAEQVVHMQVGDQWYKLRETEDEVVSKLYVSNSEIVQAYRLGDNFERF